MNSIAAMGRKFGVHVGMSKVMFYERGETVDDFAKHFGVNRSSNTRLGLMRKEVEEFNGQTKD